MQNNNFNAIRSTTIAKPAISVLNLSQICASINTRVGKIRIFIRINIRRSANLHYTPGHQCIDSVDHGPFFLYGVDHSSTMVRFTLDLFSMDQFTVDLFSVAVFAVDLLS